MVLFYGLAESIAMLSINFGAFLSVVYYFFLVLKGQAGTFAYAALGLFFEVFVLLGSMYILRLIFINIRSRNIYFSRKTILVLLLLKTFLGVILIKSGSWGLFSSDIRTGFLNGSWYLKYIVYLSRVLDLLALLVLASRFRMNLRFLYSDLFLIFVIVFGGFLSGSKGSFIFWIFSLLVLSGRTIVFTKFFRRLIFMTALLIMPFISHMSSRLLISDSQLISLIFKRFYLNNDTRALAFDLRMISDHNSGFFRESYRGYSRLLFGQPQHDPLGVRLYSEILSVYSGEGGNASYMALVTAYTPTVVSGLIWVVFAIINILMLWFFLNSIKLDRKFWFLGLIIQLQMLNFYSQDFLAYPLFFRASILLLLLRILYSSFEKSVNSNSGPKS